MKQLWIDKGEIKDTIKKSLNNPDLFRVPGLDDLPLPIIITNGDLLLINDVDFLLIDDDPNNMLIID